MLPLKVDSVPPRLRRPDTMVLPMVTFLEGADSVAAVNADADPDGVLRRPWTTMMFRGIPCLYLGLEGVLRGMAGEGEKVEAILRNRELQVVVSGAADGVPRKTVSLPLDAEGRVLVDWAGNAKKRRGGDASYFLHLPFHELLGFFEERYQNMDANFRKVLGAVAEATGEPYHPEYAALSARLAEFLAGKGTVPPSEVDGIEAKLDLIRRQVLSEMEAEAQEIEKALPTLKSQRARENSTKELVRRRSLMAGLRSAFDYEDRLRPMVAGKIAWIGSASTAGGDLHSLPLGIAMPGVDVPANVANMVLTGQTLRRAPRWVDFVYVLLAGLAVSWAVTHWGTMTVALPLAMVLSGLSIVVYGLLFVGPAIILSGAGPSIQMLLSFTFVAGFKELVTQRSKRKLQKELEKSTSPEMVKILMEHPEFLSKPRSTSGTFLFSDVKGFTSISEKMTPDVLFPFINRMLDTTTQALKAHQAYIDKYVGDGVVALFGMPVASPDHAKNACLAALECQVRLKALNEEFLREGLPQIRVRIGVNSGDTKAGMMGAVDRSSYTAMGDPINLASRLEGANKNYDTYIMIGEQTLDLVRGQFVVRELDRIRVVGKKLPVRVYELIASAGAPVPFPPTFLEGYDRALKLFQGRHWGEALEAFQALLRIKPGDKPCENYVERAGAFLANPPPADQEIVFELHSK
jgi:class 3 adenylate cyclase/CHASE2 domain-containing sensor protein